MSPAAALADITLVTMPGAGGAAVPGAAMPPPGAGGTDVPSWCWWCRSSHAHSRCWWCRRTLSRCWWYCRASSQGRWSGKSDSG